MSDNGFYCTRYIYQSIDGVKYPECVLKGMKDAVNKYIDTHFSNDCWMVSTVQLTTQTGKTINV